MGGASDDASLFAQGGVPRFVGDFDGVEPSSRPFLAVAFLSLAQDSLGDFDFGFLVVDQLKVLSLDCVGDLFPGLAAFKGGLGGDGFDLQFQDLLGGSVQEGRFFRFGGGDCGDAAPLALDGVDGSCWGGVGGDGSLEGVFLSTKVALAGVLDGCFVAGGGLDVAFSFEFDVRFSEKDSFDVKGREGD